MAKQFQTKNQGKPDQWCLWPCINQRHHSSINNYCSCIRYKVYTPPTHSLNPFNLMHTHSRNTQQCTTNASLLNPRQMAVLPTRKSELANSSESESEQVSKFSALFCYLFYLFWSFIYNKNLSKTVWQLGWFPVRLLMIAVYIISYTQIILLETIYYKQWCSILETCFFLAQTLFNHF